MHISFSLKGYFILYKRENKITNKECNIGLPKYCCIFSVTPFKIDQNKNQNRSIDKVKNLRKERK